jgi:hypothetical protein
MMVRVYLEASASRAAGVAALSWSLGPPRPLREFAAALPCRPAGPAATLTESGRALGALLGHFLANRGSAELAGVGALPQLGGALGPQAGGGEASASRAAGKAALNWSLGSPRPLREFAAALPCRPAAAAV